MQENLEAYASHKHAVNCHCIGYLSRTDGLARQAASFPSAVAPNTPRTCGIKHALHAAHASCITRWNTIGSLKVLDIFCQGSVAAAVGSAYTASKSFASWTNGGDYTPEGTH